MSHAPVTILLIEDISTVQFFVRNALSSLPRPYTLLTAGSLADARTAMAGKFVDLFIVDIGLPDGDGIDFLCEAAILQPQATAIIVTATPSEEHRARAEQLGVVQILSKPIQRDRLCAAISKLLGWNDQAAADNSNFRATLSGLTPLDIVQLKCMSGATSILEFSNNRRSGRVYFEKGNVAHALLFLEDGSKVTGQDAFSEIAGWQSGRVAEVQDGTPYPRTIRTNWQSLLLEVAQTRDELGASAA
jgi:DNA-binding response OmpR family regulator